uniref:Putative ribonuclease H-like domain-containing protein n=1 Tax=Tanacetum cinerariifolium TaxID=118510 RepID=A0A6L2P379_TANCI|nr:putative ribonuclease H-like domain-containing protein [Tanacetum cinerariifolium]
MAEYRTIEELLQSPTEGYGEAIVISKINADHFDIKTNLLQLVQANSYHGFEKENPHTHINNFKRITSTLKFRDVPNDVIKLMMFSYSLEGNARFWYDKEPPNSILTCEDLVNKFVNQFFPPSKTTYLKNEISRFTQRFEETFRESWERFKEMLRACPHHEFTELAQIDTLYNGLNDNDQDSLNAAAGGNLLSKTTREALQIIKNKSKIHYSRNKLNVSRMNTTSRENASKSDDRIDKLTDQILTLVDIFAKKIVTPAPVKAVEESCVTCGGNHAYCNCPNTDSNQPSVCVAIELDHKAYWALKHVNFDLKTTGDHRKLQPNELNELHDQAYENSLIYKEKTKKIHDSKIKNCIFNDGDRVLLFNYRLKIFLGKLKTHWSGPFTITKVFPYGSVELSQPDGPNFKPVAPTTAEQKLAKKNELKARGTLLMVLPDKHQLKFNSHKDAKTLMEAIEKRFRGNTEIEKFQKTLLKQKYENFTGTTTQNLAFVSSFNTDITTESVSAVASVSAVCAKMFMSSLHNVDSLSNATGRNLGANGPTSMGFDMSKVECYNCHRKRHFARECRSSKDSKRNGAAEPQRRTRRSLPIMLLWLFSYLSSSSDNELSPTKSEQALSHTNRPTTPIIEDCVSDYEDESETKAPQIVPSFVQSSKQVKSPKQSVQTSIPTATPKLASPKPASSGKRRNRKACFVCKSVDHLIKDCDYHPKKMAQPTPRNHEHRGNHKQYALMTHKNPQKHMVPAAVLTQSKPISITAVRPVSAVVPKIKVTRPRHANPIITKSKSPIKRHLTRSPSPMTSNSPPRVTAVKASVASAAQGNMSYLFDFEELNGGYVAFGGNPKGGKISGKGKIKTATIDESNLWHRRLGHINFKTINKLVKGNLVRGLPSKVFKNDNPCVACKKCKEHRASCKTKPVSSIDQPLYRLHMDLFGPTFVKSLNKKSYYLVVINDYSRFPWVFFLATKDETSLILKTFITGLENQLSLKVKVIKSDNGTEFKNTDLNQFCGMKGIKREISVPRTPQQNSIVERKNMTLIEAARTMLVDSLLPFPFLDEAVNNAYSLGKFDGKVDEGFLVGYSLSSKAFRVFNSRTCIVQETLHVNFLKNKPNVVGSGPTWLFDIDSLTKAMNYQPVMTGNQTNLSAGFQDKFVTEKAGEEIDQQYTLFPVWSSGSTNPQNNDGDVAFDGKEHDFDAKKPECKVSVSPSSSAQSRKQDDKTKKVAREKSPVESFTVYRNLIPTVGQNSLKRTNTFCAVGSSNAAASPTYGKSSFIYASQLSNDPDMSELEDITYYDDEDDVGAEADFNNMETSITVSPIPTAKVQKDHPVSQIFVDLSSTTQTRSMTRVEEPKRVHQALKDPSWIEAMQEELLRLDLNNLSLKDLRSYSFSTRAIGTKWVFKNKNDEKGIVIRNKAILVAQGHTQEEGVDYEDVFAPVASIEAFRLFLAYAFFMGFMMYQIDVKSAFLYRNIEEEVYVCQPLRFEDLDHPDKVYKVVKALYGLHQAPRAWYETLANYLLENGFQRGNIDQTLFIKRLTEGKSASTPIDTEKPLLKDPDGKDVDVHTHKSILGSLMYLTSSRPDIMFAVCACTRFQVTPKASHLYAVKRIFRYLKGKPHLGLWYPKDSPFDLVAYSDSDYAGCSKWNEVFKKDVTCYKYHKCWSPHHTTNGSQFTMSNLHKNWLVQIKRSLSWLVQKQTALGKDKSNPLTVDSLLKTIWSSIHYLLFNEVLTILRQMATGKGFSGVKTPLFEGMLVEQKIDEEGDAYEHVEEVATGDAAHGDVNATRREVPAGRMIAEMDQDDAVVLKDDKEVTDAIKDVEEAKVDEKPAKVQEVVDVVTTAKLITEVVTAASETLTAASVIITTAEAQVPNATTATLTAAPARVSAAPSRKRELHDVLNKDIDWDKAVDHVKRKAKEDPAVKRYQAMKRKPQTEAQARKSMMMYLKNVAGFKMDYFKGMSYDDIRPIFEAKFNSNVAFLLMTKEQIEEDKNRALQKINETPAERAAKRRKLDEEVEDLKRHLQIVPNEDDDVYTEATPLARKVLVVDYEIIKINNKPYYKIIRADGTHQLYINHNFYNHIADFVSGEEVPTLKIYSKPDAECSDVPTIYMQEFWATATVYHHLIRFKINNKKHIVNLEYYREMLKICPRIHNQQFDELPFEEEILAFLRRLDEVSHKKSLTQTHISHASGSGADKGTSIIPGVLDIPTYESNKEEISSKSSEDDDDDEVKISKHDDDDDDVDDQNDDDDQDDYDDPDDQDDDDDEQTDSDNEDDEENDKDSQVMNVEGDKGANEEDDGNELYGDVNINLEGRYIQMAKVHTTQVIEDTHVTLTPVNLKGQQQSSSVSSRFISNMLNPSLDTGKDYAYIVKNQSITGQYQTQDLKSTSKAGSTGIFLKQSNNEAKVSKDRKIKVQSCQLLKVQINGKKENQSSRVKSVNCSKL